jgi:tetratricopeptide (TPR) repeat protein
MKDKPMSEKLEELLLQWAERRRIGKPISVEELCQSCPELRDQVHAQVTALEKMDRVLDLGNDGKSSTTERPRTRYDDLRPNYEPIPGYRLEKRLGKGGFGEVWKAIGPGGFSLALKFVSLNGELGAKELHSLEAMKALHHPNLLAISGSWQVGGFLIIAMELADKTLSDRLQECVGQGMPGIPRDELIRYMQEAAKGIDYLNRPDHRIGHSTRAAIQHRDIKPQNILLMGGGVKIGDFGLIRILKNTVTEHTGSLTLAYAAPEFLMGHTARSSDQYSLAVTYCQLRGGRLPFFGSPGQIMQGHLEGRPDLTMIPVEEQAPVQRALDKDPERRWSTCEEFVNALATCHVGLGDTTERISVRGRRTTLSGSHGLWMGFGVVLLLVVAGLWIWLSSTSKEGGEAKPGIPIVGANDFLERGQGYLAREAFPLAIAEFTEAIHLNSELAEAYHGRADALRQTRKFDSAIADYTKAIQLKPDARAYQGRGEAFRGKGDLDKAIADFTKAIELRPEWGDPYEARAQTYEAKADFVQALADYTAAIDHGSKSARSYYLRAEPAIRLGKFDLASADCKEAMRLAPHGDKDVLGPENCYVWQRLGHRYVLQAVGISLKSRRALLDQGIAAYNEALKHMPEKEQGLLYHDRAIAYTLMGDRRRADADLRLAKKLGYPPK